MTQKTPEQEVQEKLLLYQLLQKQVEEIRQQSLLLERKFVEFETTKSAIEDIEKLKKDNEILIPLGSGCYAHGSTAESDSFLVEIGQSMIKKSSKEAINFLEEKKREIEQTSINLQTELTRVVEQINKLTPELEKLLQTQQPQ